MNIFELLAWLLRIYSFVLLGRAVVSWIPSLDHSHPAVQVLYRITEPVLDPIRRLVPPIGGVMDISMIIAFFAVIILEQLLLWFA